MKVLSTRATLLNQDGQIVSRGVKVMHYPADAHSVATIVIATGHDSLSGPTTHREDEVTIAPDRITSKAAGWAVVL